MRFCCKCGCYLKPPVTSSKCHKCNHPSYRNEDWFADGLIAWRALDAWTEEKHARSIEELFGDDHVPW